MLYLIVFVNRTLPLSNLFPKLSSRLSVHVLQEFDTHNYVTVGSSSMNFFHIDQSCVLFESGKLPV